MARWSRISIFNFKGELIRSLKSERIALPRSPENRDGGIYEAFAK